MPDLTNQFLDGYHVQWMIARGGMATVYLGQRADDPAAPPVALKVLHAHFAANPTVRRRFRREAEIGQRLRHGHIVRVFDLVETDEHLFLVMEYLPGGSLADRIDQQGAMTWPQALDMMRQVGQALAYAHQQGVIHRDVKPSNILFDQHGQAYLSDFGVAHEVDASTLTASGFQPGTVAYMSPEQIQGQDVGPASDQFSLAVALYRALTGTLPFEGTTTAALTYQIVHEAPKRLPRRADIPKGAQMALAKALSKAPEDRYPDIPAFIEALESLDVGSGAGRPGWLWAAAAALIIALLAVSGVVWARMRPTPAATAVSAATPPPSASATPITQKEPETTRMASPGEAAGPMATPALVPTAGETQGASFHGIATLPAAAVSTPQTAPASANSQPTPTPIVMTPTRSATATSKRPTPGPKPTKPPKKPTPPDSGANLSVSPVRPAPDALFATDTATFAWQIKQGTLNLNQKFELVFYACDKDPMSAGFSPIGASRDTQVTVNLTGVDRTLNLFHSGVWCWDVLVGHEKDGRWVRDLNASRSGLRFTYQRPGGGGGGSSPPGSPLPTPPPKP